MNVRKLIWTLLTLLPFMSTAIAQSDIDWMLAQQREALGVERETVDPQAVSTPAARKDLVNFEFSAVVKDIDDGDTIVVEGNGKARFVVRFSDMDTPEISHKPFNDAKCPCNSVPFRPGQPGGKAAKQSLLELLVVGERVRLECYEPDRYGRFACHVFKGTLNINREQISRGWGWLPSNKNWVRDPESEAAQNDAKAARRGAWALAGQVHPGEWRVNCWRDGNCTNSEN